MKIVSNGVSVEIPSGGDISLEQMQQLLSGKQDTLTGTNGQVVGFDADGKAVAQDVEAGGEIYSTEETRIGTWVDGKPLYRKVLSYTISNAGTSYHILMPHNSNIIVVNIDGRIMTAVEEAQSLYSVPTGSINSGMSQSFLVYNNSGLAFATTNSQFVGATLYAILEYTKTTDQATIAQPAMLTTQIPSAPVMQTAAVTAGTVGMKTEEMDV